MPVTRCAICHRLLTDPYSVAIGVGPECRGKYPKNHFPKPQWKVRHGRVELAGLIPQGNTTESGKGNEDDEEESEEE